MERTTKSRCGDTQMPDDQSAANRIAEDGAGCAQPTDIVIPAVPAILTPMTNTNQPACGG